MEIVRGLKSACLVDYTDFHLVVPFLPLVSHPPFVCLFLPSVHFLLLFRATFLLLRSLVPRLSPTGMERPRQGCFIPIFQSSLWGVKRSSIGYVFLPYPSFYSLSLSLKEKVSVSFPEKFDGARFLSSSPSLLQENHRLDLVSKGNRSPTRSTRGWRIFGEGRRGEIN